MKDSGVYSLIIKLAKTQSISVGKLGRVKFKKGFYVYTGSALNDLRARIKRHLRRKRKKLFWHIDYLLSSNHAEILRVIAFKTRKRMECKLSKIVSSFPNAKPIKSFGSSDCNCKSHLFYFDKIELNKFLKYIRLKYAGVAESG